jgi:2-polyprenyl-3-methyl-5-hydroxy-6-metoxy-1,4-benzoquinol methylase
LAGMGHLCVETAHALFEEYAPRERYDAIFMTHILEHMEDPVALLRSCGTWLAPEGRIFCAVPNHNSLHRHIGVKLGMLERVEALNDQDIILGHKRVYGPQLLCEHVAQAGLDLVRFGGLMVKPLSNRQMQTWPQPLQDAFFAISDDFPELCAEIYVVAQNS